MKTVKTDRIYCGIKTANESEITTVSEKKTNGGKILMIFFSVYAVTVLTIYGITGVKNDLTDTENTSAPKDSKTSDVYAIKETNDKTAEYESHIKQVVSSFVSAYSK